MYSGDFFINLTDRFEGLEESCFLFFLVRYHWWWDLISAVFFHILFHPFGLFCMYVETWIEYFGGVIKIQYFIFYSFSEQSLHIDR